MYYNNSNMDEIQQMQNYIETPNNGGSVIDAATNPADDSWSSVAATTSSGATGACMTLYEQYQLQQQQHQYNTTSTRMLMPHEMLSLSMGSNIPPADRGWAASNTEAAMFKQQQSSTAATTISYFSHFNQQQLVAFSNDVSTTTVDTVASASDTATAVAAASNNEDEEQIAEVDIIINNIVCSFNVGCHLNLREIALRGHNVEYKASNNMVVMKLRRPYTTASIWSSGHIACTGAISELHAKIAARRYARCLQKLGFQVRFKNYRIVNVLGTCCMPWGIKILNFCNRYKKDACYEPELHPGVTYTLQSPKATLKIFSTGSMTVTAVSVANIQSAIEHIFPLVREFRMERTAEQKEHLRLRELKKPQVAKAHDLLESSDKDDDL